MKQLKVIFDTDPGIDDAMALLAIARHPQITLKAITTVFGNAAIDTVTRNALHLVERFGLDVPVAKGAPHPLNAEAATDPPPAHIHGDNGLGNIDIPPVASSPDPRRAHQLIVELARADPGEITLIAVGRMTNLALALHEAPEVAELIKQVVVMGGAFGHNGHTGNITPFAEANIWGDAESADIVFGAGWPLTVVGLDVTQETVMTAADIARLAEQGGEDGRFIRDVAGLYQRFYNDHLGFDGFFVHDWSAVAYALHPEFYQTQRHRLEVLTDGKEVGRTLIDDKRWDRPKQQFCVAVDGPAVTKLFEDTILGRLET